MPGAQSKQTSGEAFQLVIVFDRFSFSSVPAHKTRIATAYPRPQSSRLSAREQQTSHFYAREEVVGSIPTRSTIFSTTCDRQLSRTTLTAILVFITIAALGCSIFVVVPSG